MNSGLGLNFLRIVNEEGSNGWAQVYARIPFDDQELLTKGALFGVVFSRDLSEWADRETKLMTWVDEFFNKSATNDMASFCRDFCKDHGDIEAVWIWLTINNGKREIRVFKVGGGGVSLERKEAQHDLMEKIEEGKVIKGNVFGGDTIFVWTEALRGVFSQRDKTISDELEIKNWDDALINRRVAGAGLLLNFVNLEQTEKGDSGVDEVVREVKEEPKYIRHLAEEVAVSQPELPEREKVVNSLVENRFVGPIGLKEKLVNKWQQFRQPQESRVIRVGNERGGRKKWAALLGMAFLFLLIVSLITGSLKMRSDAEAKKWKDFSEPIQKSLDEAVSLSKINPLGAKKIIEDIKSTYDVRKAEFVNGKYKTNVVELEAKISQSWALVSGEKESQIEQLADIGLIRSGFVGRQMSLISGGKVLVLDDNMGVVVTVETTTKDIKVVAGQGQGKGWLDSINDGTKTYIMSKTGVILGDKGTELIKFDAAVSNPVAFGHFGPNLYILDQGNKEIFKYGSVGDGFGERVRWLKQGVSMTVTPVDIALDTDIWVVSSTGQVERFRRGQKEVFNLQGVAQGTVIKKIAVEGSGNKLALLDSKNGSVYVCDKETGNCNQQLRAEKIKVVSDIEFDEKGTLLVLYEGKVGILR